VVLPVQQRFPGPELFPKKPGMLRSIAPEQVKTEFIRNSNGSFTMNRSIYGIPEIQGRAIDFDQYAKEAMKQAVRENNAVILKEQQLKQDRQRGLLDFKIAIPGGEKSAFTTIFGKPEVNLSVTGRANMNIGASLIKDQQLAATQQQRRIDPQFNQNLQLNIQGTIGDKLSIRTDWDTERPFDYQNRLSIVYDGYEDEILKRVELGNVSMETGNSLVRGGGALFGVKSTAQMGALKITSVLSQKEGNSQTETYKEGSKEEPFSVRPAEYQFDQHYFFDFYLRQEFEIGLASLPQIQFALRNMNQLKVYRQINTGSLQNDGLFAVALADLGVVRGPGGRYQPPDMDNDIFPSSLLEANRSKDNITAADLNVAGDDFVADQFQELRPGEDYDFDWRLGILSFKSSINSQQAIAISFQYTAANGEVKQVGEIVPLSNRQTVYLKLIRPNIITNTHKLWPLMLKNIYSLKRSNITADATKISIVYQGNPERDFLLDVTTSRGLLRDLGLDKLGPSNSQTPDDLLDDAITFNGTAGTVMFPYLEPFGQRMTDLIEAGTGPVDKEELKRRYVFTDLYTQPPQLAATKALNGLYEIKGSTKGGTSSEFNIGFALVEGSVKVNANGSRLIEGTDYEVDYALGFIRIINPAYLKPGYSISIDYENNNLLQIQQTTFAGVRAEYEVNENLRFGSTLFRLKELPLTDKIRVGDEPVNNTVIGLDGNGRFNAPWLTRMIDRIPLLQTKEASEITFAGEFAQLRPNVARTPTVQEMVDKGELFGDETRGVSFIDDFEGVENNVTFMNAFRWFTAASPVGIPGYDAQFDISDTFPSGIQDRIARNNLRAQLSWYVLPVLSNVRRGPESESLRQSDLFQRQAVGAEDILRTMDFYYNPGERGPYNYNMNMRQALVQEPQKMWAGVTTTVPAGADDLIQNNVEFIEFWVQFILPDGKEPTHEDIAAYSGRLMIDLGQISEDVVPNAQLNSEDGISEQDGKVVDSEGLSYIQGALSVRRDGTFAQNSLSLEDIGLDGVRSSGTGNDTEAVLFKDFVDRMKADFADKPEVVASIEKDPSNDDYVFWNSQEAANGATAFHQLFYRFLGYHENNSAPGRQAYNKPDTEALRTANIQTTNKYFEYELRINPADSSSMEIGKNYIVDRVKYKPQGQSGPSKYYQRWYQVRIPIRQYTRRIGGIDAFRGITHLRMWLTGYSKPFTMRFSSFEFVGSQWRKATEIYTDDPTTDFRQASINREENATRQPIPYMVPEGAITALNRGQQNLVANEQSLLLQVENLPRGQARYITRTFGNGLNLINYQNMRMFVHGEGYQRRSDAELVIRFGNDLTDNYYEYRQPVTPSDPDFAYVTTGKRDAREQERDNEEIWKPSENSVNILLSVFNILKQKRDLIIDDQRQTYEEDMATLLNRTAGLAPGAKVSIKGDPSLLAVKVIALGIANPLKELEGGGPDPDVGTVALDGEFWLNELRLSGYDNRNGWMATARTSVKMADFATMSASYNQATEGYEGIASKLGTRQRFEKRDVDVSSQVNLHKLIPDRFGWSIPLNVAYRTQYQQNVFMTREGDIRWTDYQQAIASRDDISDDEKQALLRSKQEEIETSNQNFTIALTNIGKSFSRSKVAQYTLDNLRWSWNYNVNDGRNASAFRNLQWTYNAGVTYNLTFKELQYWRPFGWLDGVPVLHNLDAFRFTLKPTSISAASNLNRKYSENDRRVFGDEARKPVIQSEDMGANANFGINFNPMPSVTVNYGNATAFNMTQLAIDTTSARAVADTSDRWYSVPTFDVFQTILTDPARQPQRQNYNEKWAFSWRPRVNTIKRLSWLTYSYNYAAGFNWNNDNRYDPDPAKSRRLGASIGNNGTSTHTLRIGIEDILKKIPAYTKAQEADRKAQRERDIEIKKKQDEKKKQQADREKQKLEAAKAKESGAADPKIAGKPDVKGQAGAQAAPKQAPQIPGQAKQAGVSMSDDSKSGRSTKAGTTPPVAKSDAKTAAPTTAAQGTKQEAAEKQAAKTISPLMLHGRRMLLNATSFKALDINYSVRTQAQQAGYWGSGPIYFMFSDDQSQISPDLRYRLGFKDRLSTDNLILNNGQAVNVMWSTSENLTARTNFSPVKNMNIDLSWAVEWGNKAGRQFSRDETGELKTTVDENGSFGTTTVAFGKGYRALFERQLQTAYDDFTGTVVNDTLGNRDGRSALALTTLHSDFREAYMGRAGKFDIGRFGFGAIPLPNWNITYSGIETVFPFLQDYVSRVSLTHAYRGRYRSGFVFNPNFKAQNASSNASANRFGTFAVYQPLDPYTPDQSSIESAFAPFIGLNIAWRNQMRSTLDYERSRRISPSYRTARITETYSQGVKFSLNYEKRGFKLPFMKKLQNTLTTTLNFNYAEEVTYTLPLGEALNKAFQTDSPAFIARDPKLGVLVRDEPTGTGRINASMVLGYQFSSMITANFEYAYTHILPRSSNTFERVTQDFRFNIVVAIRGN
jgi:cell surface protein SprA